MLRKCFILIAIVMVMITSCRHRSDFVPSSAIWSSEGLTLTPYSVETDNISLTVSADTIHPDDRLNYVSSQPLIDHFFNRAVEAFLMQSDTWPYPAVEISAGARSLALVDAGKVMDLLQTAASSCMVTDRFWPLVSSCPYWVTGAYDTYKICGDDDWLTTIYRNGMTIINRDIDVALCEEPTLFRGLLPSTAPESFRHESFNLMSLTTSVSRLSAISDLANIASLLNESIEHERLDSLHSLISTAVNDHLWIPSQGRYAAALDGNFYPVSVSTIDHIGQALAAIHHVATREMTQSLIAATPVPLPEAGTAFTSLLWGRAARLASNEQAILYSIAASIASLAGSDNLAQSPLSCSTAVGIVTDILFGITTSDSTLSVKPFIPASMHGRKSLHGLEYRDAIIDIHVDGTGNRIARCELDGQHITSPVIPASISGQHALTITLVNNTLPESPLLLNKQPRPIARPLTVPLAGNSFRIPDISDKFRYSLYINGISAGQIADATVTLDPDSEFRVAVVKASDNDGFSSIPSRPLLYFSPSDTLMIYHTRIPHELRKSVEKRRRRHLRKPRRPAPPDHLEMTRILNSDLRIDVDIPVAGDYFIDLGYWRPIVNESFLTDLSVNGVKAAGAFILDSYSGTSNALNVKLHKGRNTLRLIHHPLPAATDDGGACLLYIRLIKKPQS
ncbi:MAG: hypothetical protein NC098_03870 [Lachnoclostridium sp.]|nr:hypothetical protein [Lachnoclostridium sp.]